MTQGDAGRIDSGDDSPAVRDAILYLLDRQAIHDVMQQYAVGLDIGDFALSARCFAPDGRLTSPDEDIQGRAAIEKALSGLSKYLRCFHLLGQQTCEIRRPFALSETYMLGLHFADANPLERYFHVGVRYHDELEVFDGQWLITTRRYSFDCAMGVSGVTGRAPRLVPYAPGEVEPASPTRAATQLSDLIRRLKK